MEEIRLTEDEMVAYTYCIVWREHNKQYYGIRYKRGCRTSDMWASYFTSSKHVKKFREEWGEPDLIIIDQMFTDVDEAREYEEWMLKEHNVRYSDDWLNINDNRGLPVLIGSINPMKRPEVRAKVSGENNYSYGKKKPELSRKLSGENAYWFGKKNHEHSDRMTGSGNHMFGKKRPEHAAKLSGDKNYNYDPTLRIFHNEIFGEVVCTANQLASKYGMRSQSVGAVVRGKRNHHKGWKYIGLAENQPENES